jgi:ribosome-associated protein
MHVTGVPTTPRPLPASGEAGEDSLQLPLVQMLQVTPTLVIPEHELDERFVRASGPGGQNVNKVSTAVELRFDVAASRLPEDVKERLVALAGKRVSREGVLMIESRENRTQAQNRAAARARLVELLRQATRRPRSRKKTRPTKASRERRLEAKGQRARTKTRRGRVSRDE